MGCTFDCTNIISSQARDSILCENFGMSLSEKYQALLQALPANHAVRVVAVTKYATMAQMMEAYEAGIRDFGENKIQDVEAKIHAFPEVRWHMIGHLQKNKAKKAVELGFDLIHSIDSLALAQKVSLYSEALERKQAVLLQVNITREPQKTGFPEEALWRDFPQLMALQGIDIQGLMTIGPYTDEVAQSIACFRHLHDLRDKLKDQFACALPELSMGMSKDFFHAIECGATIIRIGSHLFEENKQF